MDLFFTEVWTVPLIPPPAGIFPYWDWVVDGPSAPYPSSTTTVGNKKYFEIEVPDGESWIIRHRSNTDYLGDQPSDSFLYTFSHFAPVELLRMDFTHLDGGLPNYQVQLQFSLHDYLFRTFEAAPVSNNCDWSLAIYTETSYYTVTLFKVPPTGRKCIFIRPLGNLGTIFAWRHLLIGFPCRLLPQKVQPMKVLNKRLRGRV